MGSGYGANLMSHLDTSTAGETIDHGRVEGHLPAHLGHRLGFLGAPRMRAMGEGRELHGVRSSGEEFPVEISLSPIETEAGRLVMSAIRDISERKRFELALREKNLELEGIARKRALAAFAEAERQR